MKKLLQVAWVVLLCTFFSHASNQQAYLSNPKKSSQRGSCAEENSEILVIFEKLSEKETDALSRCFTGLEGISVAGSCLKLKCYYFSYDKRFYHTPEKAFETLARASAKYGPVYKTGTSRQVEAICPKL